ncbi:lipopolysaccharide biosynthesis protein [Rufibacter psychrotolerans]|uniref:lipopolysaccharide biosynthesis protein n=1 Tax=Rufibacter psychrotolerans TaxID=2812556 RepID=UPI001967DE60|nr:oligosaccharide flippase family protein [Rufibacter sp. SYSU D00308]
MYTNNIIKVWKSRLSQKGSFAQNLAVTFSGSALVTLIGFVLTPILGRIYPPEEYGVFSVVSSILSNITVFSSLTYIGAFLLEKKEKNFIALVQLTILLNVLVCGLLLITILLFNVSISVFFKIEVIRNWIFVIPVLLLLSNLNSVFSNWLLKEKEFKGRSSVEVGGSIIGRMGAIGWGIGIQNNFTGLLIGDLIFKLFCFFGFLKAGLYKKISLIHVYVSWKRIKHVMMKYKEFPLYQLPTSYVTILSIQVPIFVFASSFGVESVGLYSFSINLMDIPLNILGRSIAPVFFQKATELYEVDKLKLQSLTLSIYNKMLYLGLIPFSIITVFGDVIFKYVFGEAWEVAGLFTSFLGYSYIFKLTTTSISAIFTIYKKQKLEFICNLVGLILRSVSLLIGVYMNDLRLCVLAFGISSFIVYFIINMQMFRVMGLRVLKHVIKSFLLIISSFVFFWGMRYLLEGYISSN